MEPKRVYFNQLSPINSLIYVLMGITYIFLGISILLKGQVIFGILLLAFSSFALVIIALNASKSYSKKQYIEISDDAITIINSILSKKEIYPVHLISELKIKNRLLSFKRKERKIKLRLSGLNYNEMKILDEAISQLNSNESKK